MFKSGIITISDSASRGEREDTSSIAIADILQHNNYEISYKNIVSDDISLIENELIKCCDELKLDLVLTTGGTGFSQRDNTPEATLNVIEKEARGLCEKMRYESAKITDKAYLSRAVAGIRNKTLIINLPGSKKSVVENLNSIIGILDHGLSILNTYGSANCGG